MTNNIEIKDHNSKIIHLIPNHLQEPISLIAKIKGFESIDDYIIQLVKEDLESIRDGGEKAAEFGNFISDYLEKIIPSPSPDKPPYRPFSKQQSSSESTESEKEEEEEEKKEVVN
jgi:hypothetical protein